MGRCENSLLLASCSLFNLISSVPANEYRFNLRQFSFVNRMKGACHLRQCDAKPCCVICYRQRKFSQYTGVRTRILERQIDFANNNPRGLFPLEIKFKNQHRCNLDKRRLLRTVLLRQTVRFVDTIIPSKIENNITCLICFRFAVTNQTWIIC